MVWIRILGLCCVCFHQMLFLKDSGDNSLLSRGWKKGGVKWEKGWKWSCLFSYWAWRRVFLSFFFQQLLSQVCISKFTEKALSASLCKTLLAWRRSQLSCMYLHSSRSLPSSYLYFMSLDTPWGLPHSALPAVKRASQLQKQRWLKKNAQTGEAPWIYFPWQPWPYPLDAGWHLDTLSEPASSQAHAVAAGWWSIYLPLGWHRKQAVPHTLCKLVANNSTDLPYHVLVSFPSLIHRRVKALLHLLAQLYSQRRAHASGILPISLPLIFNNPSDEVSVFPLENLSLLQPQKYCCQKALVKLQPQFEFQAFTSAVNAPVPGQAALSFSVTGNRSVGMQHSGSLSWYTPHANVGSSVWEVDSVGFFDLIA